MSTTILEHYNALKVRDLTKWNELNAELARQQKFSHFIRSVCGSNKKLSKIDFVVGSLMVQYLGFTPENLKNDEMPELPREINSLMNDYKLAA